MLSSKYIKPILVGLAGMLLMLAIYWGLLFIATQDIMHPFIQIMQYKYWMVPLILGFGVQMGLFWYIRSGSHLVGSSTVATGAGTSTVAMVACCAHHLADFLPILGLSGAAIFLTEYQEYFFLLGIISNLLGIAMMIYIIRTKEHISFGGFIKKLLFFKKISMNKVLIIIIILFSGLFIFNIFNNNDNKSEDKVIVNTEKEVKTIENKYTSKTDDQARVTVDVIPTILGVNESQNIFEVSFNTHSVEMDYNFSKTIILKDNLGNVYEALQWTGNRGGHHISGDIIFLALNSQASSVEININGVGGVDRIFKWDLL